MCGDFGFYASEIIHAIRGLKEQGTFDTIVDLVGAFGPVIISGIALWISWRSSKNTETIQKQIASSEKRSFVRSLIFEVYSSFFQHEELERIKKCELYFPNQAHEINKKLVSHKIELLNLLSKLFLVLLDDKSEEALDLKKVVKQKYLEYKELSDSVGILVYSREYVAITKKVMEEVKKDEPNITYDEIAQHNDKWFSYVSSFAGSDAEFDKVMKKVESYLQTLNKDSFGIYFQKYLNTLSK